jgi:uncharacterized membrane protein
MAAGGYGPAQATGVERDNAQAILNRAYAEGRLTLPDFESRSAQLQVFMTREQLAGLTADLPGGTWGMPPPGYFPGQPVKRPTSQLAIAALVCGIAQIFFGFLTGIPAIILGHLARRRIRETGEDGDGMALAGLILGYIGVVLSVVVIVVAIVLFVAVAHRVQVHRVTDLGRAAPAGFRPGPSKITPRALVRTSWSGGAHAPARDMPMSSAYTRRCTARR